MYHEWVDLHFQSATFHRAGHFTAKLTFCDLKLILASWAVNLNPLSRFNSGGKDWSILESGNSKTKNSTTSVTRNLPSRNSSDCGSYIAVGPKTIVAEELSNMGIILGQ